MRRFAVTKILSTTGDGYETEHVGKITVDNDGLGRCIKIEYESTTLYVNADDPQLDEVFR